MKDRRRKKRNQKLTSATGAPASPPATVVSPPPPQIAADGAFWRAILAAVETRPLGLRTLRGASGLDHELVDLGIDDARNRIVAIADSPDPKTAAFLQSDLQRAHPSQKVIVARTQLVNVSPALKGLANSTFLATLSMATAKSKFERFDKERLEELFEPALNALMGDYRLATHSPLAFLHQLLSQIASLDWKHIETMDKNSLFGPLLASWSRTDFDIDHQLGICPIPVFNMTADEVENAKVGTSLEAARMCLVKHGIWGYFFPSSTELALGLIDHGVTSLAKVNEGVALAPIEGHPLSEATPPRIEDVVQDLKRQGFVVEGELGFQTTIAGAETRALVKFKPKESLLVKLKNLMAVAPLLKYFIK